MWQAAVMNNLRLEQVHMLVSDNATLLNPCAC